MMISHITLGLGLSLFCSLSLRSSCCLGFGENFLDDSVAEVEDLRLFLMLLLLLLLLLPTMELLSTATSFGWCIALLASETHRHLKHFKGYVSEVHRMVGGVNYLDRLQCHNWSSLTVLVSAIHWITLVTLHGHSFRMCWFWIYYILITDYLLHCLELRTLFGDYKRETSSLHFYSLVPSMAGILHPDPYGTQGDNDCHALQTVLDLSRRRRDG